MLRRKFLKLIPIACTVPFIPFKKKDSDEIVITDKDDIIHEHYLKEGVLERHSTESDNDFRKRILTTLASNSI